MAGIQLVLECIEEKGLDRLQDVRDRGVVLAEVAALPATLVWFESPRRLSALLEDLAATLGPREACIARELTKLHEEWRRGRLPALAEHYAAAGDVRGEVTVIVGPPDRSAGPDVDADVLDAMLAEELEVRSPSRAAAEVAARTGNDRRQLYNRAVTLRRAAKGTPSRNTKV